MQAHTTMSEIYHINLYSYGGYPKRVTGLYLLFYTWPTSTSMNPPVGSYTSSAPFLSGEHSLVVVDVGHSLGIVAIIATLW